MKRIIELPDDVVKAIQNGEDYRYDIHTAIAQSIPYNPTGDLISRKVIKGLISDKSIPIKFEKEKRGGWHRSSGVLLSDIYNIIDNAPTVEPKRPQGEWIMQQHGLDGCFYTCSNCGRMIRVPLFIDDPEDNETLADYPFCHCGADMRGGAE